MAVAVALYTLTRSLTAPALAILFRVAPRPVGSLIGGHLADRRGPIPTLVALNLGRAVVTGALAVALGAEMVPLVLALLALSQAAGGAAQPVGQAAIPRLVPASGVARLNAAVGTVNSGGGDHRAGGRGRPARWAGDRLGGLVGRRRCRELPRPGRPSRRPAGSAPCRGSRAR